jgi:hypothetical protein
MSVELAFAPITELAEGLRNGAIWSSFTPGVSKSCQIRAGRLSR